MSKVLRNFFFVFSELQDKEKHVGKAVDHHLWTFFTKTYNNFMVLP